MNEHPPRDLAIIDFDGTLTNLNSIQHLLGEWDEFHKASFECPPNQPVVEFVQLLGHIPHLQIVIVSGKPTTFNNQMIGWLGDNEISPDFVICRPTNNSMSDAQLKPHLMAMEFGDDWRDRVLFALEDRDKMVDAWRALGVTCFQCAESLY